MAPPCCSSRPMQAGNWLSWGGAAVEHPGRGGAVTASDLLARTALYKVGHHRSHNATLRARGLKLMTRDDLMAMIPVDHEMAARQDWAMPLPGLLHRLEEKTKGRV